VPEARLLTGAAASEAALAAARGPKVVHVATHGFFLSARPDKTRKATGPTASLALPDPLLASGLALAGANGAGTTGDGVLTGLEAASLDLYGTELVVLSACETGVGTVDASEGVFGLRRALALAGAETLVMSLWKVDDAATRALMVDYYRELWLHARGRSEGLREAQLHLLAEPRFAHPFYWASFIVSGQSGPLAGVVPPATKAAPAKDATRAPGALAPGGAHGCGCELVRAAESRGVGAALLLGLLTPWGRRRARASRAR
jgi:CHAT domain-containing protein